MSFSKIFPRKGMRTPAFIVSKSLVEENCKSMLKLNTSSVHLRACTKTHKTIEGVNIQTGGSLRGLVCSTLAECEFFAQNQCDDIIYGYPLIHIHMERATKLHNDLQSFHVMIDSLSTLDILLKTKTENKQNWSVFIAIDVGYGREGIMWNDHDKVIQMARLLNEGKNTTFMGLYTHCGGSYEVRTLEKSLGSIKNYIDQLTSLVSTLKDNDIFCEIVGLGSTPTCLALSRHQINLGPVINEIHPGNYIFRDLQQVKIGNCEKANIACVVATSIVGHYPSKNTLIVDCGFIGMTKQGFGETNPGYGEIKGHDELILKSMSQEHGIVTTVDGSDLMFQKYPIGSLLYIYPWHSCATADKYSEYLIMDKDGNVTEEVWKPVHGW